MAQREAPGVRQPGQVIRPVMDEDNAKTLARKLFGLTVTSIKELNSYDDKNFLVQVDSETSNPHIPAGHPHGYVLKVANSLDSKNAAVMAAQNEMMLFLLARGIKVPRPEKNVSGSHWIYSAISGDKAGEEGENIVRLVTFLPGKILCQVPYNAKLFFELGALVARVDNELRDFHNEALKQRRLIWCLESAPELSKFLFAVKEEGRRRLVEEVLEAWQTTVVPLLPTLERGFIHGDLSDYNIIVSDSDGDPSGYHIGLIDFGDIQHSCYVFELAIILMYLMLEVRVMAPEEAVGHALAGYLTQRAVTEDEWSVLKECIAVRFAQSLVMGAYSYTQDQGNEYLLITAARGWEVLGSLWRTPKDQLLARWKATLKKYQ